MDISESQNTSTGIVLSSDTDFETKIVSNDT